MTDAPVILCCFLWAVQGEESGLSHYEDSVLALVSEHRGAVLQRARSDGTDGRPHEIQLFRFEDKRRSTASCRIQGELHSPANGIGSSRAQNCSRSALTDARRGLR